MVSLLSTGKCCSNLSLRQTRRWEQVWAYGYRRALSKSIGEIFGSKRPPSRANQVPSLQSSYQNDAISHSSAVMIASIQRRHIIGRAIENKEHECCDEHDGRAEYRSWR